MTLGGLQGDMGKLWGAVRGLEVEGERRVEVQGES